LIHGKEGQKQPSFSWLIADQRYTKIVAWLLLILGGIGWFGGIAIALSNNKIIANSAELPLGDLNGIAVDSSGRVYCGLGFYSRIQQYDSNGKFIKGWSIDADGGMFKIRVNAKDEIEVVTARTDAFFRYDATGTLLEEYRSEERSDKLLSTFQSQNQVEVADSIVYVSRRLLLFPAIIKLTADGRRTTLITTPIHKWVFMGPFPAWLFWLIAILLLQWKDRQKKATEMRPEG
jgi:hypothetical protein